jgi:glycosyltransferase involved in cell wall biosynthesis
MRSQGRDEAGPRDARGPSPLVSVIIPTFNRARFLPDAIESVLSQGVESLELIVVDGVSSDDTMQVLRRWDGAIRVIEEPNKGIGPARNVGVRASRGEFLAFLDSDDYWLPGKLRRQLEEFERHPELEAVYGNLEQFYDDSVDDEFRRRHPIKTLVGPARVSGVMLIRRQSFFRVGLFDPAALGGVDIAWGMSANQAGLRTSMLPEVVTARRLHEDQVSTKTREASNRDRVLALKRGLDARRAAEASQHAVRDGITP